MRKSNTVRNRIIMLASTGLILILAGCAATATPSKTSTQKVGYSEAEPSVKRSECKAPHETMMTEKEDYAKHQVTPEMMEKHLTCMKLMPEMKAKMQAKCEAKKVGGMAQDVMGNRQVNHDMMGGEHTQHMCAMMDLNMTNEGAEQ